MREKLLYLAQRYFTSADVCAKPLIHQGRNRSEREIRKGSDKFETRGDVMIRVLWDQQTDATIDVKLGDTDTDSYIFEPMATLFARQYKVKKDKHSKHCHDQQKNSPRLFFLSMTC